MLNHYLFSGFSRGLTLEKGRTATQNWRFLGMILVHDLDISVHVVRTHRDRTLALETDI